MEIDEKQIKDFSEFAEVAPTSTHNLITDKGRCSVGAFFEAMVDYASDKIDEAVALAASKTDTSAKAAASSAANAAKSATDADTAYDNGVALYNRAKAEAAEYVGSCSSARTAAESARDAAVSAKTAAAADALKTEGYALGKQDGEAVGAGSPYYQANAKYFADTAAEAKTAAETANTQAAAAKTAAELAQTKAEAAQTAVENAKSATDLLKTAAETAKAQSELARDQAIAAKNQAQEIVDPDNRIGQLFQTKLDKGVLYCNGGYAKVPRGAFISLSKATMLVRFARSNTTRTAEEYICNIGDGGSENTGISLRLLPDNRFSVLLKFKKADGTLHNGAIPAFDALPYLDKKIHSVAVCWAGTSAKIYIDGVFKGSASNIPSDATIVPSNVGITLAGRGATNAQFFYGRVSDFAVLNYDASEVDSDGNYTSDYSIADYQNGRAIPPWTVPIVFGNGKSASANTVNASCVWSGANWSMTQTSNAATVKSMLYYIPLNVGQKLHIRFSNLTGGVLVDGKYGFFQPVGQEADKIDVSTTSLNAEFTAATPITLWRFQFNCEAVDDAADRVPTVFENFVVERDGAIVALENYTFKNKIRDTSGNGNTATVSGVLAGDRDGSIAQMYEAFAAQYTADNP